MEINLFDENLSQKEIRDYLLLMFDSYLNQHYLNNLKNLEGNVLEYNKIVDKQKSQRSEFLNYLNEVTGKIVDVNLVIEIE